MKEGKGWKEREQEKEREQKEHYATTFKKVIF